MNKQTKNSHNPNLNQKLTPKQNQKTGCINFYGVFFVIKVVEINYGKCEKWPSEFSIYVIG